MTERGRSANLLDGMPFTVAGQGKASETVAAVLSSLGAEVDRLGAAVGQIGVHTIHSPGVVVCDLVEEGVSDGYVAELAGRASGAWVTISAFGTDGPYGRRRGSDLICAAAGGLLNAVTGGDGAVYPMPGSQALQLAGQAGALAALHAAAMRQSGQEWVHLDVSAQEAVAFCTVQQECAHLLYECGGRGGASRYSAPTGVFPCLDGAIRIIVIDDHQWHRLSEVLGRLEWPSEYPTITDRARNGELIDSAVREWTASRSKFVCEQLLQGNGVAACAIRNLAEVQACEHLNARDFLLPANGEALRCATLPALVEDAADAPSGAESRRGQGGLRGLQVAEVTNVLAGPLAGAILGAMGAEVVRLEDEQRLDMYRRSGPFHSGRPGRERAAYYLFANYNKRSVTRRIGVDQEFTREVVKWADVVLENVGSRRLERLGLGDTMIGPMGSKTLVSISGFGKTGPRAAYKGYAPNIHAFAGLIGAVQELSLSNAVAGASFADSVRTSLADYCVALWAATLAVAWWLGGSGPRLFDLSMAEVVASKLEGCTVGRAAELPDRPVDQLLVSCSDGAVALASVDGSDARTLLRALGIDIDSVSTKRAGGVLLVDLKSAARNRADLLEDAEGAGLQGFPAKGPMELLADPQLGSRGFIVTLAHPEVLASPIFALPWKTAGAEREGYRRAPLLGEDDDWIEKVLEEGAGGQSDR